MEWIVGIIVDIILKGEVDIIVDKVFKVEYIFLEGTVVIVVFRGISSIVVIKENIEVFSEIIWVVLR